MRTPEGKLMTLVESYMSECIHRRQGDTCAKGVKYADVETILGLPCFRSCTYADGECDKAEWLTLAEATTKYEGSNNRIKKIFNRIW